MTVGRRILGPLVQRTIRVCGPPIVILLAVAVGLPAIAQTWSESAAAYERGDYAIAYRGFRLHAEQGDAGSQYYLGLMYVYGFGVPQDYAEALKWYRRAAEQSDAHAQHDLGSMYFHGIGVPQDYTKALEWYRRAAEQSDGRAQFALGAMYLRGDGIPQDYTKAADWYRRAAEQGVARAQSALGTMYLRGDGVPQDYTKAADWYRRAAEQGAELAQFNLGVMYYDGEGVPQDYARAAQWFRRAAEQAYAPAQLRLGHLYYDGWGIPQDYVQAHRWFSLAASDPSASRTDRVVAFSFRDMVELRMGSEQLAHAQRLARDWKPKYEDEDSPASTSPQLDVADSPTPSSAQMQTGSFTYDDGSTYEGEFKDGKVHGHGTYVWPDGTTYTGDFVDGLPEGTGTTTWPDGGTYTGDFVNGRLEGTGTHTLTSGTTYTGDFVNGRLEGTGTITWPDGTSYMGKFVDGRLEGAGTIAWPDGSTYSGVFDRRAAEQGNAFAQLSLGILYYYGLDVPQDDVQAHKWFNIAGSRLRDSERRAVAIRHREQVASRLSSSQLARAFRLAREWQPKEESDSPAPGDSQLSIPDSRSPAHLDRVMTGSGFRVSADGHILTNAHVVRGCTEVRAPTGISVRVVAYDDAADLALLESPSRSPDAVAAFRQGRGIRSGASVVVVGHPLHGILASEASVSAGIVSALAGPGDDRRLIQITAPVQPGNSGGPVLDSAGNVIGVVVARLDALEVGRNAGYLPQNVNFAVAAGAARAFLDAEGVPYLTSPSQRALPTDQVAAIGKRFTVLVECWKPRT